MRGTGKLGRIGERLESLPLVGPPLYTLMYGMLFAILMIYVFCSMRFPIDPSAVEPPYRQLCFIVTIVNVCFALLLLADCVRVWTSRMRRKLLALAVPLCALVLIACVQVIAVYLQQLRVR